MAIGLVDAAGRPLEGANPALSFFRNMLRPFLEAYFVAVVALRPRPGADGPRPTPSPKEMLQVAERLYLQGDIDLPEARSGVLLANASKALGNLAPADLAQAETDLRAFVRHR